MREAAKAIVEKRYTPVQQLKKIKIDMLSRVDPESEGIRGVIRECVTADLIFATTRFYQPGLSEWFYPNDLKKAVATEQAKIRGKIEQRKAGYMDMFGMNFLMGSMENAWLPLERSMNIARGVIGIGAFALAALVPKNGNMEAGMAVLGLGTAAGIWGISGIARLLENRVTKKATLESLERIMGRFPLFYSDEAVEYLDSWKGRKGVTKPQQYKRSVMEQLERTEAKIKAETEAVEGYFRLLSGLKEISRSTYMGRFDERTHDLAEDEAIMNMLQYLSDRGLRADEFMAHMGGIFDNARWDGVQGVTQILLRLERIQRGNEISIMPPAA